MFNFLTSEFFNFTFTGITNGMIYAAIGLALVLIWQASHVLNFAQGAMAMATSWVAYVALSHSVPYWLAFILAVVAGFFAGGIVEVGLMRPLRNKPEINPIVVSVGLFVALESLVAMLFVPPQVEIPAPFSTTGISIGSAQINFSLYNLFTSLMVLAVMGAMFALFRFTNLGLKMRAAAFAPEVSRSVAAMLFVSDGQTQLSPTVMDSVFIAGFAAAAIGGLESPIGALVGGLAVGLTTSYVGGYYSSSLAPISIVILLVIVLMVRPQGIFSRPGSRRV
jgi:branched-chain amino acid transport system permease protein